MFLGNDENMRLCLYILISRSYECTTFDNYPGKGYPESFHHPHGCRGGDEMICLKMNNFVSYTGRQVHSHKVKMFHAGLLHFLKMD